MESHRFVNCEPHLNIRFQEQITPLSSSVLTCCSIENKVRIRFLFSLFNFLPFHIPQANLPVCQMKWEQDSRDPWAITSPPQANQTAPIPESYLSPLLSRLFSIELPFFFSCPISTSYYPKPSLHITSSGNNLFSLAIQKEKECRRKKDPRTSHYYKQYYKIILQTTWRKHQCSMNQCSIGTIPQKPAGVEGVWNVRSKNRKHLQTEYNQEPF